MCGTWYDHVINHSTIYVIVHGTIYVIERDTIYVIEHDTFMWSIMVWSMW